MVGFDGTSGDRVLQQQARALGDPHRHAIFRYVARAGAPVRVSELAEQFALNHNAIRQHLAKLCAAGLLLEQLSSPNGPGRPALQYRPAPEALSTWTRPSPYQELAVLLASAAAGTGTAREVGAEVGRRIAEERGGDAVEVIEAEMVRRGFEPRRAEFDDSPAIVLQRCAFAEAAAAAPHVVCELHLGLTEGIAQALDGYEVSHMLANDPAVGGCQLRLRRTGPAIKDRLRLPTPDH